jgi:predicted N-formylglutamate amidohydrolase
MKPVSVLLGINDGPASERLNPLGTSNILLICEHASNRLPERLGTLGLPRDALEGHIAWDIGAGVVTDRLSDLLDAQAILQRFSRLAYNCNRAADAPDVIPHAYRGRAIPGNAALSDEIYALRREAIYVPFEDAITRALNTISRRSPDAMLVCIQSFAGEMPGAGDAEIALIEDEDAGLANALQAIFRHDSTYRTVCDRPYNRDDGATYTLAHHATARRLPGVIISIRNELIASVTGQDRMARYLASTLREAVAVVAKSRRTERRAKPQAPAEPC